MSLIRKVEIFDGTNTAEVMATNGSYGLVTVNLSHVSTLNSYESTIASGGTWTGTSEDISNFGSIFVLVTSSENTIFKGFNIEFSTDGINWVEGDAYTLTADKTKTFSFQCAAHYFRIYITNDTDGISTVSLQTILKPLSNKFSSHRIGDNISQDDDAELVKSALTAKRTSDDVFVPITASNSNNLRVTDAENTLAIAKGEVVGASKVNKWGNAPDFDSTDGEVDIWDGAEDAEPYEAMTYTFSTDPIIDSVSSQSVADVYDITVEGLDSNWEEITQTVTLAGQNRVALTTDLIRVHRAYNSNGVEYVGHVFVYEDTALNVGIPIDVTKIRAIIHPEEQQTEMAIYSIPAGKTGYLLGGYASTAGAKKDTNYVIKFKIKLFEKVFRTQQKVAISDTGSSFIPFTYPIPQVLPEKTDVKVTALMTASTEGSVSAGFNIVLIDN